MTPNTAAFASSESDGIRDNCTLKKIDIQPLYGVYNFLKGPSFFFFFFEEG